MRTAFATAAIAASANALDAVAIPDFIAGFIYGLTGDNHLAEIEQCYQGGQSIVTDGQAVITDLKTGHLIQGVKDAKTLADAISPALSNCQNMDGDIAEIEAWAKGFEDIGHLTKEVTKNWLLHKKKVKADIAQEEADWSSKDYFGAGKETAYALDLLVPFSKSENGLPVKGGVEFLGGFLDGFIGDSHLTEIAACEVDAEAEGEAVEKAFADFEAGHKIKAITEFKKIVSNWQTSLTDCQPADMTDDLQALEAWSVQFKDPKALIGHVTKRFLTHRKEIETDFSTMKTDWASKQYTAAGEAMADLVVAAIGPVNKSDDVELDVMAVPDFVAGILFELTGDNDLEEIESCYKGGDQVVVDAEAALADIKAGHFITGVRDLGKVVSEIPDALSTCEGMQDDINTLETYAAQFKNVGQITKEVAKNWLLHGKKVKADIAQEKSEWASGDYFNAGKETAAALELLVPFTSTDEDESVQFNLKGDGEFLAGFVYGFIGDNHLSEIETCYTSSKPIIEGVEAVLGDLKNLHFIKAIEEFEKVLFNFQVDTAACHDLSDDLATIATWAGQFKHIPTLIETVGKHYLVHQRAIKKDIQAEKADWAAGSYFKAGADVADAVTLALGPMEAVPDTPSTAYLAEFEKNGIFEEVTHLLAGFIYGMTKENHLTELQACWTGGVELEHGILKSISDFKQGGWNPITQGVLQLLIVALQLPQELHTCTHMSDDLSAIEDWGKQFTDVSSIVPKVTKHFLVHKKAILADVSDLKADMAAEQYFKAGVEAADIATILLPIA